MKKNIIFIVALFSSNIICGQDGQVGINTENPQATLHVEGNQYVSTITKIGGERGSYNTSVSLELGDEHKAFLPNRVPLTDNEDKTTVPDPVAGMVVYNTNDDNPTLSSGLTYFDGQQWSRLVTESELPKKSTLNRANLQKDIPTTTRDPKLGGVEALGAEMDMGSIDISEKGAYVFNFRLYGRLQPWLIDRLKDKPEIAPAGHLVNFYFSLIVNDALVDAAEIDIVKGSNTDVMTYSVTLAAELDPGDKITFRLGHHLSNAYPWYLISNIEEISPVRTSMVWWKL